MDTARLVPRCALAGAWLALAACPRLERVRDGAVARPSTPGSSATPRAIVGAEEPAAIAPTAKNAIAAARTLKFAFHVSREISCSRSFESDSTWGSYVLTLTPPHGATLVFERVESHTFGASRFEAPGHPARRTERRFVASFDGAVVRDADAWSLTLHRRKDECAKGEPACAGALRLSCTDSVAPVTSFDDKGKHVTNRAIVRCTPDYGFPIALADAGWKGGLAFAEASGLYLSYPQQGPLSHPPELRPAP